MPGKKIKLIANVSSANPLAIKSVLERKVGSNGTIKPTSDGFDVTAEFQGECIKDVNRMLLSELRRAKRKPGCGLNGPVKEQLKSTSITSLRKQPELKLTVFAA